MTFTELAAAIAQNLHRTDLTSVIPQFISNANERINRRFGVALTDSGDIPEGTYLLYYYAALQAANEYLNNGDNARYYADRWELEADRQNVLSPGTVTDNYAADLPVIIGA